MRQHYIDNLRWSAISILIFYHAAMAWNCWGEPNYIIFEPNSIIAGIIVFFSPFFMPVLFILAGMSTRMALQKRSVREFVRERITKLFIPFLSGSIILMPVMTYIADKNNYGYSGGFLSHYVKFFTITDWTGADGGFSVGQFWFLLYLFVISIISLEIISLQKKLTGKLIENVPLIVIMLLGLPFPVFDEMLSIGGKSLLSYLYLFLIGYYLFTKEKIIEKVEKYRGLFLVIGLIATFVDIYLFLWSPVKMEGLNTASMYIARWFMILASLGMGKAYFNKSNKFTQYMTRVSFAFYELHFIWIVLLQYFFKDIFAENEALLYLIPVILSYAATFLSCELFLRLPILCRLFGLKYQKK